MAGPLIGTLTIGQAPRPDVSPILESHLPPGATCLHAGLLDGLVPSEIAARYGHRPGGRLLVTRLLDGTVAQLDAVAVEAGLRDQLRVLEARGCNIVVLLCTGVFNDLRCDRAWLVEPDRVIPPVASAVAGSRAVGVVVPDVAQIGTEAGKWQALACPPRFAAASPYVEDLAPLAEAARRLRADGAGAVVLDCIGYTERHRAAAVAAAGCAVFLSNTIVARVVGELASAWGTE